MPFTTCIKYVNEKFKESDCNWVLYFCLLLENCELIPGVFFDTILIKPMARVFIKAGTYNG